MSGDRSETTEPLRILVCEDNLMIANILQKKLCNEGFAVVTAPNRAEAQKLLEEWSPQLLLLDLVLPDSEDAGWELLEASCKLASIPTIILSGRGRSVTRVLALQRGADDFITKPFSLEEVAARIEAVLRRYGLRNAPSAIVINNIHKSVMVGNRAVSLSPKEFRLLNLLASSPGTFFSTQSILAELWPPFSCATSHDVQKYVYLLRKKLRDANNKHPNPIVTVRGQGYSFTS